jgi:hypothetical protein
MNYPEFTGQIWTKRVMASKSRKSAKIPAGIDLHGDSWRVRINRKGYKVVRLYHNLDEAILFRDRTLVDIKGDTYKDRTREKQTTLKDLLQRYLEDETPKKKEAGQEAVRIKRLQEEDWAKLPVASIRVEHITNYRKKETERGLAPNTVATRIMMTRITAASALPGYPRSAAAWLWPSHDLRMARCLGLIRG